MGVVKEVLPETPAGLLIGYQWSLLAARMDQIRDQGGTGLLAVHCLTTPPSAPAAPASRGRVSPAAARSRSTNTPAAAASGGQALMEAAVPAHRQQTASARARGDAVTAGTPTPGWRSVRPCADRVRAA
ncbi:hypothetical protein [Streptomyces sp. NPDC088762]|uniref:hypothetical protein n=1 Tax=Streptomyces sp. NPDC088762 TaxID=3365891 RepID=UPI00380F3BA7